MARVYTEPINEEPLAYFTGARLKFHARMKEFRLSLILSLTIFTLSSSTSLDWFNCFTGKPMRISTQPTGTT